MKNEHRLLHWNESGHSEQCQNAIRIEFVSMLRRMKWNDSFGFYAMFRSVEIDDFRLCSLCVIWVTDVVMSFAFLILMFNCHVLTFSCGRRKKEQSKLLHTLEFFRFSFQKEARSICVCFGISVYIWVVSFNCTTLIAVGIFGLVRQRQRHRMSCISTWLGTEYRFMYFFALYLN